MMRALKYLMRVQRCVQLDLGSPFENHSQILKNHSHASKTQTSCIFDRVHGSGKRSMRSASNAGFEAKGKALALALRPMKDA